MRTHVGVSPSLVGGTEGTAANTAMSGGLVDSWHRCSRSHRDSDASISWAVGSYLSTIEAVGTGSWLSAVQVLLDVSIALLVAIIEFHGGIQRGYRTISSDFFFVKRYMQDHLDRVSSWRKNLRLHWDPPKFFFQVEKSTTPIKKSFGG